MVERKKKRGFNFFQEYWKKYSTKIPCNHCSKSHIAVYEEAISFIVHSHLHCSQ